jgi:hypothetical protein
MLWRFQQAIHVVCPACQWTEAVLAYETQVGAVLPLSALSARVGYSFDSEASTEALAYSPAIGSIRGNAQGMQHSIVC